jgi:hypothetical protein
MNPYFVVGHFGQKVAHMAEWEVALSISGPITTLREIRFDAEKGYVQPFWTNISVKRASHGVVISLVARAENKTDANDAAVYFVGQALDLLCLEIDLTLYVSLTGAQIRPINDNVRRILNREELVSYFDRARQIGSMRPTYSRALSWYRKAMSSEDPVDAFISYWSSIEGVGSKFARDNETTRRGVINKICDYFDQVWGGVEHWQVIPNEANALNAFHELRNGISHGFIRVDVETVKSVARDLNVALNGRPPLQLPRAKK